MSSEGYIYVLGAFAAGVILAICSTAYCIYIRYSTYRLSKKIREVMLKRMIHGMDPEEEGPINMNHPRRIHSFKLSRLIPSKRQVPSQRQFPDVSHTDSRTYVNVPGSGFNAYSSHDTFDGYEQQPNYPEKNDKGGLQEIHNFDPPSQTSSQLLVSYTSSSHSSSHHSRPGHVRQSYGDEFEMTTPRQQSHPRVFEQQQGLGGPMESRRQVLRY